jgi:protein MpaA
MASENIAMLRIFGIRISRTKGSGKRRQSAVLFFLSAGLMAFLCAGGASRHVSAQSARDFYPIPSPTPSQQSGLKSASQPLYIELGRSVKGSPITAVVYGTGKRRVIVFGGIHGNESDSSIVAKALMGSFWQERVPEGLTIIVVPDVNPDGLLANTRANARGVDINRNFPSTSWRSDYTDEQQFPGAEPASEPETRAVIKLLETSPPDFIITLHAALGCVNWDGPGEELARVIANVNGYPLCPYLGYETPGSLGTLMGADKKLPVVTIELRNSKASDLVQENVPALRALLSYIASSK